MLRDCLTALLLSLAVLPAQGGAEIELPADPPAAIAAMPIAEPAADGVIVRVEDGETGEPIAGADVVVTIWAGDRSANEEYRALHERALAAGRSRRQITLGLAALRGVRYRTRADGTVAVSTGGVDAYCVALAGESFGGGMVQAGQPIRVFAPRWIDVRVLTAEGKPARGVPLGVDRASGSFGGRPAGRTDAQGRCRLEVDLARLRGQEAAVAALVATRELVFLAFDAKCPPAEPIELRLPPCGQVRFILYGEDERPANRLQGASIAIPGSRRGRYDIFTGRGAARLRLWDSQPGELEADNCTFGWVEIGHEVVVQATVEGLSQPLKFAGKGPTRARELVVVEGRINVGPPTLTCRLLDQQGNPVTDEEVGVVLRGATHISRDRVTTDADGRLQYVITKEHPERLVVVRRREAEATDYRGAAFRALEEYGPGKHDLGDLQLVDEPVAGRARLVDGDGKPVAGVWVRGPTSITTFRGSGRPGGASGRDLWCFEHRVRTDADGWFELRELEPMEHPITLWLEGAEWTVPGPIEVTLGNDIAPIRVWRTSTIAARLAGDDLQGVRVDVKLVHQESGCVIGVDCRDGVVSPARVASGAYDITIGGGDFGFTIAGVQAPLGGEVEDPRLDPIEWQGKLQLVGVKVTDAQGNPIEGATVWRYIVRPNGKGGSGFATDAAGRAAYLAPLENLEVMVEAPGYVATVVETPSENLEVKLKRRLPVTVQLPGLPELPTGVQIYVASRPIGEAANRAAAVRGMADGGQEVDLDLRRAELEVEGPGRWGLDLQLRLDYGSDYSQPLQRRLRRALPARPFRLEFEIAGPGETKTIELTKEQKAELEGCLTRFREILEEDKDG